MMVNEMDSKTKKNDISYLVDDKYLDFFVNPKSECAGKPTGYIGSWNYPDIMIEFKGKVLNALEVADDYYSRDRDGDKPVWAKMRDKYFGGRSYVYPDEMIQKLDDFDNREIVAFLYYCVCYKERFFDGAYGDYAEDGYIGKLLLRLKELPLTID